MTTAAPHLPGLRLSSVADALGPLLGATLEPGTLAVVSVPAPLAPLEALLDARPDDDAVLWSPPSGPCFAAIGAAETILGHGADRITEVARRGASLFARIVSPPPEGGAPPARVFGGFSFQPGAASAEPWSGFGDARFVLPRFTYAKDGGTAWLSVAARAEDLSSENRRRALVGATEQLVSSLRSAGIRAAQRARDARELVLISRQETSESEWRELVEAVRDLIAAGDVEKVVVARRVALSFDGPVRVSDVLGELARSPDPCTRFAFRLGRATFLGATPERLLKKIGLDVDTEALAGSSRSGDPERAAELLGSAKELSEHSPVVRELLRALGPLCVWLEHPEVPQVRALRHLLHLVTPVRGRLAAPAHVLDLVQRLHPTPAVGGVPVERALPFIAEHEAAERGWYAAPVGWFDAQGDGEFNVALRSGLFAGSHAYLYAGGGIVRDSDPASEYAETRLKLATLYAALRVPQ